MDFLELVEKRYSCRSFSTKQVEKGKLDKILKLLNLLQRLEIYNHKKY